MIPPEKRPSRPTQPPLGKSISVKYPTPELDDLVVVVTKDVNTPKYDVDDYGTAHPDTTSYPDHKLSLITLGEDGNQARWFYVSDRVDQDLYNFAVKYTADAATHKVNIRTYVLPRTGYTRPANGASDPIDTGLILTHEEELGTAEQPEMASLYIKVIRVYEKLPGPWVPFTRYDDNLGPVQGRRRAVLNTGQIPSLTPTTRTTYEGRDGSSYVSIQIEETWTGGTGDPGDPLFPVGTKDWFDAERGAVQQTKQIVVADGTEVGSLVVVDPVVTLIRFEPYNEFLLFKIVETWAVPGPLLRLEDKYDTLLGKVSGTKQLFENESQSPFQNGSGSEHYESSQWGNALVWKISESWQPSDFPLVQADTYSDERGPVYRTTQLKIIAGGEEATFVRDAGIVTKTWFELYNEFLLKQVIEVWTEVTVDDLRVTSEHGGAIYKHTERTDEPGAQTVETGLLILDSKLVKISPHEQKLITDKFDPSSAVAVLELLLGGSGYAAAPTVSFSGGTCGTGPVATAVLGFGVASVTVNNGGSGFFSPPAVGFGNGGGGSGFAIAVLGFGVAGVVMIAGGSYSVAPSVAFSGDGTGATGNVVLGYGVFFAVVSNPGGLAKGTLTSDNTNVSNNDTVTIGSKVYTFKTALTPTEGQVLIGASADASLLNLIRAINHTGTPGTDYSVAAANLYVTAAPAVTAHAFQVTARQPGTIRNTLATTEVSSHLSWGAATLVGGFSYTEVPRATLSGDGVGAQAQVVMGSPVGSFTIANHGTGFTTSPQVVGNGGGSGLDAEAVLGFPLDSIDVDTGGTGYDEDTDVVIGPPESGGVQAEAEIVLGGSAPVSEVDVTNGGSGFTTTPTADFSAGAGTGAAGTPILGFALDSVTLDDPGVGFITFPSVLVDPSPYGTNAVVNCRLGIETADINTAGTGYVVDDILDIVGGTNSVVGQLRVTSVAGGSPTTTTLAYVSNGDANGVGYFAGTNYGAIAWENPHTAGRLVVSSSTLEAGTLASIVNRDTSDAFTSNIANQYFDFDLGAGNSLELTDWAYRVRDSGTTDVPTAFDLLGSNDGVSFTPIDSRTGLTFASANEWARYSTTSPAYRYFRLKQTALDSSGQNYFSIGEFELYGDFTYTPPAAITGVSVDTLGVYSALPAGPVAVTGGGGSGATFDLTWLLVQLNLTTPGDGYPIAPDITISGGGATSPALGSATLESTGSVVAVTITNGGTGYTADFAVGFTGGGGTGAAATALVPLTSIGSINITNPGRGYTSDPPVTFVGAGTGATASANRETTGGEVWRIDVLNGGVWETAPLISFVGGGGSGADATATLDVSLLHVHRLLVTATGRAYTTAPLFSFRYLDDTVPVDLTATSTLLSTGEVISVIMTAQGSGYTTATPVFSGGVGSGASATTDLAVTGSVKSVTIVTPGFYKNTPTVGFIGGGGTGAVGTAVLASTGSVVELILVTPGTCTVAPTVIFTGSNTSPATALYHIGSDEWPINPGFYTDDTYGIVVDILTQVVQTGRPHPGRAALCLGNFVDQKVYDRWKSIRVASKVNLLTLPCPETFPMKHGLRIPPRLLSIEVVWTGGVSKLVSALQSSTTVRVSSGANSDLIVRSSQGFSNEVSGFGIREWFFGPPPLAYFSSYPIFNARGASGSAVVAATNSSTGQTQAGPGITFQDSFQSQVHAVDIRDHLVGSFEVISTDIVQGQQHELSRQTVRGGTDVVVQYRSQSVSGFAIGPGGAVGIVAAGTPATMKVSIPASLPATMFAGSYLLAGIFPERWRFDVWNIVRVYVPTPQDLNL